MATLAPTTESTGSPAAAAAEMVAAWTAATTRLWYPPLVGAAVTADHPAVAAFLGLPGGDVGGFQLGGNWLRSQLTPLVGWAAGAAAAAAGVFVFMVALRTGPARVAAGRLRRRLTVTDSGSDSGASGGGGGWPAVVALTFASILHTAIALAAGVVVAAAATAAAATADATALVAAVFHELVSDAGAAVDAAAWTLGRVAVFNASALGGSTPSDTEAIVGAAQGYVVRNLPPLPPLRDALRRLDERGGALQGRADAAAAAVAGGIAGAVALYLALPAGAAVYAHRYGAYARATDAAAIAADDHQVSDLAVEAKWHQPVSGGVARGGGAAALLAFTLLGVAASWLLVGALAVGGAVAANSCVTLRGHRVALLATAPGAAAAVIAAAAAAEANVLVDARLVCPTDAAGVRYGRLASGVVASLLRSADVTEGLATFLATPPAVTAGLLRWLARRADNYLDCTTLIDASAALLWTGCGDHPRSLIAAMAAAWRAAVVLAVSVTTAAVVAVVGGGDVLAAPVVGAAAAASSLACRFAGVAKAAAAAPTLAPAVATGTWAGTGVGVGVAAAATLSPAKVAVADVEALGENLAAAGAASRGSPVRGGVHWDALAPDSGQDAADDGTEADSDGERNTSTAARPQVRVLAAAV
ncbi:hypothetical protein MMPV_002198 [Pyropia vietnamensis]